MSLKPIVNIEQLRDNILQVEKYLDADGDSENRDNMLNLIRKGTNFVAYQVNAQWRFAPSRFLGYQENKLSTHLIMRNGKNGTVTSPAIDIILKSKRVFDPYLEKMYLEFCKLLNILPKQMVHAQRKYWYLSPLELTDSLYCSNDFFSEGRVLERRHKYRERNQALISRVKNDFKLKHNGELYCEICGFNFKSRYKGLGDDYIEAHHIIPISEMKDGDTTSLKDMRLVCSNCHRMIHSKIPCYSVDDIQNSLKQ